MGSQTQATDRFTLSLQAPCRPPKTATMPMMPSTTDLDLVNRDPNNINDHIKVAFEDVFAEPEGAHSCDCIWKNSYCCFEFCKRLTYMLLTTFYGICIAMEWGAELGRMAFIHIWYITPMFKVCEINCGCCQKIYGLCVHCCMDPCCEACGLLFHAFKK